MESSGCAPPSTTILSASVAARPASCAHQPGAKIVRLGDRGGEPDRLQPRRELFEPRQAEREQIAALRDDERVQLVEDHRREPREEAPRILRGDEQRHLLRRRQEDVGRIEFLPLALVDRRVAGPRLKPDGEPHLRDRRLEVAMDVDGERLQRRDVERVRPDQRRAGLRHLALRSRRRDRRGSAGSRRASSRRRSARSAAPIFRPRAFSSSAS